MTEPAPVPNGRYVGWVSHDGERYGVADRMSDNLRPIYQMDATTVSYEDREKALAWVRSQLKDGYSITDDGRCYRNLPDVTVDREERAFDKRLLMEFMDSIPDHIDHSSAIWGAAQVMLIRRRMARAADRQATDHAGQDHAQIPE